MKKVLGINRFFGKNIHSPLPTDFMHVLFVSLEPLEAPTHLKPKRSSVTNKNPLFNERFFHVTEDVV